MPIAFKFLSLLLVAGFTQVAVADIYTCKHPDGTTELTDSPCARNATVVNVLKSAVSSAPPPQKRDTVQNSPKMVQTGVQTGASNAGRQGLSARVEPNVQRARDDVRRNLLSREMEEELRALAGLQGKFNGGTPALAPGESSASPQYLERRAQLTQTVSLHEKNIAAIKQEISNLR
jgi:Domain of unknown function (DUF4124)